VLQTLGLGKVRQVDRVVDAATVWRALAEVKTYVQISNLVISKGNS
jgi:ribosomal protein L30/L7E